MDVFDAYHICNHSDGEGRYAYNVRSITLTFGNLLTHVTTESTFNDVGAPL